MMNTPARPTEFYPPASQLPYDAQGRQTGGFKQGQSGFNPIQTGFNQPGYNQPGFNPQNPYLPPRQPARDISKDELWEIAHNADLTSLLKQPQPYQATLPPRGPSKVVDPNCIAFEDLDLTLLGLPTIKGGRRRERDIPFQDPTAILAGLNNIPDIASRHKNYHPNQLEEWPLVDIIIHEDLIFIIVDAPGFDLQSYYFEEAEPDVLLMVGQKTHQAALVELDRAPPNVWVFRQRPIGNTFVRKVDLRRFNFKLDPATLTYGNYNGCIVYRGLREQPVRPKQLFRYV
jgi:hypothetical protein